MLPGQPFYAISELWVILKSEMEDNTVKQLTWTSGFHMYNMHKYAYLYIHAYITHAPPKIKWK